MNQKYSFKEFLTKETYIGVEPDSEEDITGTISKVEIPMIQRDYAQGRIKEYNKEKQAIINDTGSRFLRAIFNALKTNSEMELEFIYGSVDVRPGSKKKADEYVYVPLDGQQRLTTLYLLYWYMGMRELDSNNDEREELLNILSKFTYLTRSSSRIFCECLCNLDKIKGIDLSSNTPSKQIENCPWFYKEYKKDPTVKSMLAMLDHINSLYNAEQVEGAAYLPRLENLKFYVFPLNKYKLTEDLYIKMNARGKQLSGYENFKADLINWMKSKNNPEREGFCSDVEYRGRRMKYYMAFAQKIDNEWTDIFWNVIKNNEEENKVVDGMFMRFLMRFFFNERILKLKEDNTPDESTEYDKVVKYFYGESGSDAKITYNSNDFDDIYSHCLSYDSIRKIEVFLDRIQGHLNIINAQFSPSWQKDKENAFYSLKINWQERIIFHAIFKYFYSVETFNEIHFRDWTRVAWNFVADPTIRNFKDNVGALKFIDELSKYSEDIINYLAQEGAEGKRFKDQFAEEHIKAILVNTDPEWRDLLVESEKLPILKGRISFLLSNGKNTTKEEYNTGQHIAKCIIPKSNETDYRWIQAILAHVDKYDFGKDGLVLSNERDNWKTILSGGLKHATQALIRNIAEQIDTASLEITDENVFNLMNNIIEAYSIKDGVEWAYPLISWFDPKDGLSLLQGYSYSRKVVQYDNNVYLCWKTRFQEDNSILLNTSRDYIISMIMSTYQLENIEWHYTTYTGNICNKFFRGTEVTLPRVISFGAVELKCSYTFDAEKVIVGARRNDNTLTTDTDSSTPWVCSKVYEYPTANIDAEITGFIERIENEVFDLKNPDSLMSKANTGVWENEVKDKENESSDRGLTITFPDGVVISNKKAIDAFIAALEKIGLEKVAESGVKHSGYNLVGKEQRPVENGTLWQKEHNGWYIYSNISNNDKKDDLKLLCPGIIVEDGTLSMA